MKRFLKIPNRLISFALVFTCLATSLTAQETDYTPQLIPKGYSAVTISTPIDESGNKIQFGVGGIATASGGIVMVASRTTGIWKYQNGTWSIFAEGIHDPQGIYLPDLDTSTVIVAQKPELTLIRDLDGDGIADQYRTLCDQWRYAGNYCEYVHGPMVDSKGNYYVNINLADGNGFPASEKSGGAAMATTLGYDGWVAKITPEGTFIPFASGLRSPAGIGIRSNDELFYTDNQGGWVGSSTLHQIVEGGFYGYPCSLLDKVEYRAGKKLDSKEFSQKRKQPVLWLPHGELVNSPGNPVFDETDGQFGPFSGQVFIGCQTRSSIVRGNLEKVNGEYQGAVFNFIDHLQSGCIRLSFDPHGKLWVGQTGRGWASKGGKMYGLQRIEWDGETVPFEIHSIQLTSTGFQVNFTQAIDVSDFNKQNVQVSSWHYLYHGQYGSPKVDEQILKVELESIAASAKSLRFNVPLETGKVYRIELTELKSKLGETPVTAHGYYTLNNLLAD